MPTGVGMHATHPELLALGAPTKLRGLLASPSTVRHRADRSVRSTRPMHATLWGPRFTPARCLTVLAILSTISAVGTLAAPMLASHPLALVLLSPRLPFLALAGGHVSPLVLIPLVAARLCVGDVFHFHLGASARDASLRRRLRASRVGAKVASVAALRRGVGTLRGWVAGVRSHRATRSVRRRLPADGAIARHGLLLAILVRPIGRHLALAGASGTCGRRVAVVDVVGTMAYVVGVVVAAGAVI